MMQQIHAIIQYLKSPKWIQDADRFFRSRLFIGVAAFLVLLSNLFGLELVTYTLFTLAVVFICFKGTDLLGLAPMLAMAYMSPSMLNNPGRNAASVFSAGHGGIYILLLALVMIGAVVFRLIQQWPHFVRKKRPLMIGMLALSGAYLLSGIGSAGYMDVALKNSFFALLQSAALVLPYWLLSGGVNWRKVTKDYFAWIGIAAGGLLVLEILWIYLTGNVIQNGIIVREQIYTGWGMYNNIGGMLAMMIPFVFYLAIVHDKIWLGMISGSVLSTFVLLTCSRSSISSAAIIFSFCMVLLLYRIPTRPKNKKLPFIILGVFMVLIALFHKPLLHLFSNLLEMGLDPSSRDSIYKEGLDLFSTAPVLGTSFYSPGFLPWDFSTVDSFSSFFPPRWHNTIVQLLACCGLVGLFAYLLHRLQTVLLFLQRFTLENVFIACSIAVLIISCMFDCHFFNIGPVLFYSTAMAFAECIPMKTKKRI